MLSRSKEASKAGRHQSQAMESGKLGWEALVVTQWLVLSRSNFVCEQTHYNTLSIHKLSQMQH